MNGPGLAPEVVASAPMGRLPRLAIAGSLALHAAGLAWAAHATDPAAIDPGPVAIEVALVTAAPLAADSAEPALVGAIDRLALAQPQNEPAPALVAASAPPPKPRPRPSREAPKVAVARGMAAGDLARPAAAETTSRLAALAGGGAAAPAAAEATRPQSLPAVPMVSEGPPVVTTAAYRERPRPPPYPRRAVDLRQQGTAVVRALVGLDGETRDVVLWRSSGVRLLDEAAVAAARDWLFQPARIGGRTIEAWVEIPVHFNLRG